MCLLSLSRARKACSLFFFILCVCDKRRDTKISHEVTYSLCVVFGGKNFLLIFFTRKETAAAVLLGFKKIRAI